jgi:hypothetical protein
MSAQMIHSDSQSENHAFAFVIALIQMNSDRLARSLLWILGWHTSVVDRFSHGNGHETMDFLLFLSAVQFLVRPIPARCATTPHFAALVLEETPLNP